jgi:transposase InsO family protein
VSRHDILTVLHATAGRASVRQLKAAFAHVSRAEIRAVRNCYRRARARLTRHEGAVLQWHLPRAVWAVDFTDFASGIEDHGRDVLVVRDLGSGATLSADPEPPDAAHVCGTLARLIAAHGAPLVVKSDNGSCFLAEDTRLLLAVHQILGHFSPPGTPSYNGSCEAGVGSVKHRAVDFALRRGPASPITLDDLELARQQANAQPIDDGPTRAQLFEEAQPPSADLRQEVWARYRSWQLRLRRQHGVAPDATLPHPRQASLDRFAIGKALTETGILTIRRR